MSKLKVAVIGAGSISDCHLQAYASNPDVEIYAICDLNEARAAEMAKNMMQLMYSPITRNCWPCPRFIPSASVHGMIHTQRSALPHWTQAKRAV